MVNNANENLTKKRKNKSDKKGVVLVVVLSVIALILVGNAVKIQTEKKEEDFSAFYSDTTESTVVTLPPVTETTATTAPLTQPTDTTTAEDESTQPTETTASAEMTNQEILDIITNGVNTLKSSDASFIGHKVQVLDMELTECSAPAFTGIVNKILDMFIETEIYDFDFTNGKGMDPENKVETTTMDTFPPEGKNFSLTIDGVVAASKEVQGENTVYKVKLKAEKSTKDNPKTLYHENACDTLDLSTFNMPLGEITKADLDYPGATVAITLDKNGKVVGYYERLDIIGVGEATAVGMSGGGKVVGYVDETWTIEWK
jgi:hypothetical protein